MTYDDSTSRWVPLMTHLLIADEPLISPDEP